MFLADAPEHRLRMSEIARPGPAQPQRLHPSGRPARRAGLRNALRRRRRRSRPVREADRRRRVQDHRGSRHAPRRDPAVLPRAPHPHRPDRPRATSGAGCAAESSTRTTPRAPAPYRRELIPCTAAVPSTTSSATPEASTRSSPPPRPARPPAIRPAPASRHRGRAACPARWTAARRTPPQRRRSPSARTPPRRGGAAAGSRAGAARSARAAG